ncbi:uncharacterized protein LOC116416641 isoform X1 [Nasonia vitripennis]|uniref:Uncharacterized protein n=2 Tax=Nasonia vitripennis TaxID=7425 RepID=A0A7M7Q260_NASVI|nr:uncharacterized protein LOC116415714 isoform X1 [Nasonia vitripennis]XP_031780967.1 uncharacterized protein LOC116416433 isoform X1 [Nasonia vitripennis]XP_031781537.1 uncharacterized protein LOC116416641 isoform X1 [Nasonia vitripennis]
MAETFDRGPSSISIINRLWKNPLKLKSCTKRATCGSHATISPILMSRIQKKLGGASPETATSNLMADLQRTQAENPKLFQMLQKSPVHQHRNDITRKNSTPNVNKQPYKHQATNSSRHLSRRDENIPQASTSNMTMEKFQREVLQSLSDLKERLSDCERMTKENNSMLKTLTAKKKVGKMSCPSWLPFKSVEDLISFENVDDETFNQTVDYLVYLGGRNVEDSLSLYLKSSFEVTESLLKKVSWLGQPSKNITSLSESRFIRACEEAVSSYNKFRKPNNTEFSDAVTKALKALKENLRRQIVAKAAKKQLPRRSRSRSSGGSKEQSRGVMELEGGQPTRQSRPRSRSPDGSKDQRRKVMGLQKKIPPRQSRVSEVQSSESEFLSHNNTSLLTQSPDGSKDRRRDVMELHGKQPYRLSRPPRSRSPDGSNDRRRSLMGLQKKRPPQQSRSRSRSPDLRENRFETSTSRRRSMELQKKQELPRQSRLRSRSPCGSEDYFEASTPKKSKVMEQEQNEFLSRNDTLLLPHNINTTTVVSEIHNVQNDENSLENIGNRGGDDIESVAEFQNDAQDMEANYNEENDAVAEASDADEGNKNYNDQENEDESDDEAMQIECLVDDPDVRSYILSQTAMEQKLFFKK